MKTSKAASLRRAAIAGLALTFGAAGPLTSPAAGAPPKVSAAQALQDRMAIEELMSRYEWALDTGDADAYAALFTEDGVLANGPSEEKGRAAIAKSVRDLAARFNAAQPAAPGAPPRPPRKVQHSYSDVIIDLNGDEATSKSFWTEVWNLRDGVPEVGGAGQYADKLVKRDGQWRFSRREIIGTMSPPRPARPPAAAAN